ncbi:Hypothetical protein R9X50_00252100 [Acrodontium crateriforme]|uniref:Uncharacterized protein n=1 Tax=Acrodontium crateriforme TaxID=150365 RepID=A0AAQ3M1N9_9PEZI|nr:Hypothetical protein R9X50_00252100 [Acrodontium crateriforme]
MITPRSFKYSSSPPADTLDEKRRRRTTRRTPPLVNTNKTMVPTPSSNTTSEPTRPPSQPVAVPKTDRLHNGTSKPIPSQDRRAHTLGRRRPKKHDPDALPPSVAALLAMTTIPRRKPNRFYRKSTDGHNMSIDQLVNEWKSEDSLKSSYSSSPLMNILLEDLDEIDTSLTSGNESGGDDECFATRCTSCESMPSLEADNLSMTSVGSPSTPESLRSRRSSNNLKRDRTRSLPVVEDCATDHPLATSHAAEDDSDDFIVYTPGNRESRPKNRTSFKSNLTLSLQVLKNAAINSISSFTSPTTSPPTRRNQSESYNDMLWSHPFLFPRLSSEIRPAEFQGLPTEAQRRYLNPMPLTFEEQEAPFQQALHAPFLAEQVVDVPTIELQTHSRGSPNRRRTTTKTRSSNRSTDPSSEAGRAMQGAGIRPREPRENSDFLRVVVLEMNMRRQGKLENGRARIWLPPRKPSPILPTNTSLRTSLNPPRRWVSESAYS